MAMPPRSTLSALVTAFLLFAFLPRHASAQAEQNVRFGGTYDNLKPAQRALVDEWFRQFNEVSKRNLKLAEAYDDLSLSVRTTFEAVTHALMTSKLTDANGRSLGTAFDVISYLETVHGKIPESSGDLQFRIYVALKPTALQTLEDSREFKHTGDNTVYHKGYPTNYRQQGGTPSIQISCSRDGRRADIDVDYRSSKFPKAAVNGHLSSSNSDVRAGNNYAQHARRWSGFADWWKSIFGVPLKEADLKEEETKADRGIIPAFPRSGKGKIEEAMHDFLNSWLVEQQPNLAVAYISPKAYSCIDQVESDEKKQINPGLVRYYIVNGMKKANRSIGKPASLAEAAESVQPTDSALKLINQPHSTEFALFETPEDLAFDFECANRNSVQEVAETAKPGRKYGKYFGAALRLKTPGAKGATLVILWTKESGYWKIVSWDVESDKVEHKKVPNVAEAGPEIKIERVTGDPGMIAAAQGFFDDWFVKQNFEKAVGYLSEQCYPCVNLNASEGEKKVRNWSEGQRKILDGMKNVSDTIGRKHEVGEAIRSITPAHPAVKLVSHPQEQAYALVSVPDEIAKAFECQTQAQGVKVARKLSGLPVYGNYYGTILELKVRGTPAALRLLWGKEKDQWKIVAYSVEVP
jgi:hypothetical protein